jgi:hypothetical protein
VKYCLRLEGRTNIEAFENLMQRRIYGTNRTWEKKYIQAMKIVIMSQNIRRRIINEVARQVVRTGKIRNA